MEKLPLLVLLNQNSCSFSFSLLHPQLISVERRLNHPEKRRKKRLPKEKCKFPKNYGTLTFNGGPMWRQVKVEAVCHSKCSWHKIDRRKERHEFFITLTVQSTKSECPWALTLARWWRGWPLTSLCSWRPPWPICRRRSTRPKMETSLGTQSFPTTTSTITIE